MKKIVDHPSRMTTGKRYWRSLDDLADTPAFRDWLEREFPQGAAEMELDGVSRRSFLRLMGASLAFAGLGFSGCRRPEAHLVPHAKGSEWIIPGKSLYYATAMPRPGGGMPLVVTTHDGRPTKIEGNPLHPASNGSTDLFAQATILDLYDPDRARFFVKEGKAISKNEFAEAIGQLAKGLEETRGAGAVVLCGEDASPTRERLKKALMEKCPNLMWVEYEPLDPGYQKESVRLAFGEGVQLRPRYEKAKVIVSIGSDCLGTEVGDGGSIYACQGFAAGRAVAPSEAAEGKMNRLYVAETRYTATGGMADHRLRLRPSQLEEFAAALGTVVAALTGDESLRQLCAPLIPNEISTRWIEECAKDLFVHRRASLVVAGARESVATQTMVHAINHALGNVGTTIEALALPESGKHGTLKELVERAEREEITTLINLGVDLAFCAPTDLDWNEAAKKIPTRLYLGSYFDDSARASTLVAPKAHFLEGWGDTRSPDGTYMIVQPMIMPLFGGWTELQVLDGILGKEFDDGPDLVRTTFQQLTGAGVDEAGERRWALALRDGFVEGAGLPKQTPGLKPLPVFAKQLVEDAIEVVLIQDFKIYDGRYANNGWLQETPDVATKLTWDNAAIMSPATAQELGVKDDDLVQIEVGGRNLTIPALLLPGHADRAISVAVGYGREDEDRRVLHKCGFNAYQLATTAASTLLRGAKVAKGQGRHKLAETQEHGTMEGRDHVRAASVDRFAKDPEFAKSMGIDAHIPPNISLYHNPPLDAPHQWGMTIDLSLCTGCQACHVACQAENNIPIVGREQVINGREMTWIRVDRYFASLDEADPDPEMVMQPIPCMHCENAPCETVCPVNATVHNEEGLNVMAYNRCIGTRYCGNNCPYKVRRFNYFDFNKRQVRNVKIAGVEVGNLYLGPFGLKNDDKIAEMQKNPNVTIRMRGVIEKCSFCVQRLEEAKINHKVKTKGTNQVKLPTDSVQSACMQACPTGAIIFGDISDPASRVSKAKQDPRNYELLSYLNTRPRVTFLARLKNPNPAMPEASRIGSFNIGSHSHHDKAGHAHEHEHVEKH